MKVIFKSINKFILFMLVGGIFLLSATFSSGLAAMKPPKDFGYLLENEPRSGMHIKGNVLYTYDSFASEETYTKNSDGSHTMPKTSSYYYAIPVDNGGVMAMKVPADSYKSMQALLDETFEYLSGGAEPSTEVMVDSSVRKLPSDIEPLLVEYLEESGFSQAEIEDMRPFMIVDQGRSMATMLAMFWIGFGLIAIAVAWSAFNFIRNSKKAS